MRRLFTLTFEVRVKKWCHMFVASIHSLEQLVKGIHEAFDTYDYQVVCHKIDLLKMELGKHRGDFINRFLHLCYEFLEGVVESFFITENFQNLILFTLKYFGSKPLDYSAPSTYMKHEIFQICEE